MEYTTCNKCENAQEKNIGVGIFQVILLFSTSLKVRRY